jgi:CDGSH-type Zn-finger protein
VSPERARVDVPGPPGARRDGTRSSRAAEIRAYPDGPFLVRGPVTIVDGDGRELHVRRRVVALCRCGRSRRQPLCDGTHTAAGFTCAGTPAVSGTTPTLDLRAAPRDADADAG